MRLPQHVSPEAVRQENPSSLSDRKLEFTGGDIKKPPDEGAFAFCVFNRQSMLHSTPEQEHALPREEFQPTFSDKAVYIHTNLILEKQFYFPGGY